MNTKQLILGLSILVPAVCGAKPNNPFTNETIDIPIKICESNEFRTYSFKPRENAESVFFYVDQFCSKLEYRGWNGLVFVRANTMHGVFFGFAIPKELRNYKNEVTEAVEDLKKQLLQYPGNLRFTGWGKVYKLPRKLDW